MPRAGTTPAAAVAGCSWLNPPAVSGYGRGLMKDTRLDVLARGLVNYSTAVKPGERVLIELFDAPEEIGVALIRAVRARGGVPFLQTYAARLTRELLVDAVGAQYQFLADVELRRMKGMQAYIAVRGAHNIFEASDVPAERQRLAMQFMRPVQDWRVKRTKWVVLRWPTPAMAQQAMMSTEAFEDFYFKVCALDYAKLVPGMKMLQALMARTDRVHIKGPGTDLRFSIKGIGAVICGGLRNIPDGEVFSCPVRDSVEGEIAFNTPTVYQGASFDNVRLKFAKGQIIEATANNTKRLNEILDADAGARYIGEFSLGCNPRILQPMRDILFDEKIAGSFHFTPGQAYEEADNGNRSQVHWDLVCIQRRDCGGGEIWFDDKLIRKNGLFTGGPWTALNPDQILRR
ncbi:MAG: aminopeptidase [Verrucomicrobiales bacterium]|nr:aminopeptidase [Verrucomicrobiales bacterium]